MWLWWINISIFSNVYSIPFSFNTIIITWVMSTFSAHIDVQFMNRYFRSFICLITWISRYVFNNVSHLFPCACAAGLSCAVNGRLKLAEVHECGRQTSEIRHVIKQQPGGFKHTLFITSLANLQTETRYWTQRWPISEHTFCFSHHVCAILLSDQTRNSS